MTENYEEKLWQEIMRRNYDRKLWGEIITGNYEEKLSQEIMRRNYHRKLWGEIITGNYQLVYFIREKCGNYRDTGVSKKQGCNLIKRSENH